MFQAKAAMLFMSLCQVVSDDNSYSNVLRELFVVSSGYVVSTSESVALC